MAIVDQYTVKQQPFINKVDLELKRAERYSIFVSVLLFDLSFLPDKYRNESPDVVRDILDEIHKQIRDIDDAAILGDNKLALLFPETDRQGAEIAARRLVDTIKKRLEELNAQIDNILTPEMASYPDAAGARSIKDFLMEYSTKSLN